MSESTLNAAYKDLQGDVGFFLGFGRGADLSDPTWTAQQQNAITRAVKGGLRKFYFCGYEWSFLRPVTTLTLLSAHNTLTLPDDYGGKEGQLVVTNPPSSGFWPIDFVGVGQVYQRQSELPTTTGRPLMVCDEPIKGTGALQSSRMQLRFWPIADQAYTVQFQYYILPDYLSGAFPYAYGGAQHAETLLAACKAVAELEDDDIAGGPQEMSFMRLLEVSKELDRRNKPQTLGYNRDLSDWRHRRLRGGRERNWPVVTQNGVAY